MHRAAAPLVTIAATIAAVQWLDRPSVAVGAVPLAWAICAIALAIEIAGVTSVRRFATAHRRAAVLSIVVCVSLLALTVVSARRWPVPSPNRRFAGPSLSTVTLVKFGPEIQKVTNDLIVALRATSNLNDFAPCATFLKPDDTFGPEAHVSMLYLLPKPGESPLRVTPPLAPLSVALRSVDVTVDRLTRQGRMAEASRWVAEYRTLLKHPWVIVRQIQPKGGVPNTEAATYCAYGLVDITSNDIVDRLEKGASLMPME